MIFYFAPKDEILPSSPKIDKYSTLLLSCGLGSFVFALNQVEMWGIQDLWFWGILWLGCVLLLIFALRDKNAPFQIFPSTLLKNKSFMGIGGAIFGTSYCFSLILIMVSLYLQNTLNLIAHRN